MFHKCFDHLGAYSLIEILRLTDEEVYSNSAWNLCIFSVPPTFSWDSFVALNVSDLSVVATNNIAIHMLIPIRGKIVLLHFPNRLRTTPPLSNVWFVQPVV